MCKEVKTALTIAGSDSGGGAGIQADIKTMMAHGVYAMSAVTALTAQNTMGVQAIMEVPPDFLKAQLDAVFTDIRPDAVKIGMMSDRELIEVTAERLRYYRAEHIVVDPVMVSTSGSKLLREEAVWFLAEKLFPLSELVTPNIPEGEVLSGLQLGTIRTQRDMMKAAEWISQRWGCSVLLKGGHLTSSSDDLLLLKDGTHQWLYGKKIHNPNTHGTGCTLSSAIAANLAKGMDLCTAASQGKAYISKLLESKMNLGHGSGPLDHGMFFIT